MSGPDAPQPNRLAKGGLIDRTCPLRFRFDGAAMGGYAGDTLASALMAGGTRLVARSFKYHRPRGILTAGAEEPNALVELGTGARREPNTRATVAELFDGLVAASQNRWPSLAFDLGAVNSLLSPFLAAGFYYKTFMWPAAFWEKLYEPLIRRAAGMGRASLADDPDRYEKAFGFCDVLVIGGGPAGLSAALAAGRAGARVILCDEDFLPGGRLNGERDTIGDQPGAVWAAQSLADLATLPNVQILTRTTLFGAYDSGTFGAAERVADHVAEPAPHAPRQRLWRIVARRTVLTAGAVERPLVFGGNDRPGVMMASAVRTYLNRFGVTPGRRVAVFTTGDDGCRTAADLRTCGIEVAALIDARAAGTALPPRLDGVLSLRGAQVVDIHGSSRLNAVTVRQADGSRTRIEADTLAMAGGWNPALALATHLGQKPRWSEALSSFVPGDLPVGMRVAGAASGALRLSEALQGGHEAGRAAAGDCGYERAVPLPPDVGEERAAVTPLWHVAGSIGKAFVDFQHDVTADDIALAAREGYRSVELLKRYTTLGMATDQGKTSNLNGHAMLAALVGRSVTEVGITIARPPHTPVALGVFAGHHRGQAFRPTRLTQSHAWATGQGAVFVQAGDWLRAQWFPRPGETDWLASVSREVKAVREAVGVCDVSTLGKIDIKGSDAGAFLDFVYTNHFSTLPVGKTRYGLMLREDGMVLDDGTSARLAADHIVMSTTTANAARVMQHLEHVRQVTRPDLDVQLASITEQWSQFSVAGPRSRALLERLLGGAVDLSDQAFPYMAAQAFAWRGVSARLFRISFSGERAYELAVRARFGAACIRAIMAAGAEFGVVPYGTEALGAMRVEKGHVAGTELNGTTTPSTSGSAA